VGEPQDIANLALFIVSAQAEWITGAVIPADGGSSLGTVKHG
jgi:NAD(P)-dependent dehydrogenase (short-subunit alcohol dehydrogenase family)